MPPRWLLFGCVALSLAWVEPSRGEDPLDAGNRRFALDLASRAIYEARSDEVMNAQFLGFDFQQLLADDEGDYGTLLLQGYLIRIHNMPMHPAFFEDANDVDFEFRNFYYNYTGLSKHHVNFKIGHYELPYGLETTIDTNGTLRDFTLGSNVGVKADWGASVNGVLPSFEYEVGLTRGSGNDWETRGNPYAVTGRIGSSRDRAVVVGLSGFHGRIVDESQPDGVVSRSRIGLDGQWDLGALALLGEVSFGADDRDAASNALLELDVPSPDRSWLGYLQLIRAHRAGSGSGQQLVAGASWDVDNQWTLSGQWSHDLATQGQAPEVNLLALQLRYRF